MSYNRTSLLYCENNFNADCSVEAALAILGGKWKLKIYRTLRFRGVLRFNEMRAAISDISDKTLAAQLKEMEADNLITRQVYPQVPPKVEYRLTELGKSLEDVFEALDAWGKSFIKDKSRQVPIEL
jgi:DNA-binding HxlR family transcriptional regulator